MRFIKMNHKPFLFTALFTGTLSLVNCGGGGGKGLSEEAQNFIGTWRYTTGTSKVDCPPEFDDADNSFDQKGVTLNIAEGIETPLVLIDPDCTWNLDVSGTTASSKPNQKCETDLTEGDTQKDELTIISWVMALDNTGTTLTETANGTMEYRFTEAKVTCDVTGSGLLNKISK